VVKQRNPEDYRRCAGVALFNKRGQVFLGHRINSSGQHVWQFPQGGMDKGETPLGAAVRELYEETGVKPETVKLLGKIDDWLYYDFPADYLNTKKARGRKGQRQRWYAFLFTGKDDQVDLDAVPPTEFSEWRWGKLSNTPKLIVPFKRKIYERLADEFEGFAKPHE